MNSVANEFKMSFPVRLENPHVIEAKQVHLSSVLAPYCLRAVTQILRARSGLVSSPQDRRGKHLTPTSTIGTWNLSISIGTELPRPLGTTRTTCRTWVAPSLISRVSFLTACWCDHTSARDVYTSDITTKYAPLAFELRCILLHLGLLPVLHRHERVHGSLGSHAPKQQPLCHGVHQAY